MLFFHGRKLLPKLCIKCTLCPKLLLYSVWECFLLPLYRKKKKKSCSLMSLFLTVLKFFKILLYAALQEAISQ